MLLLAPASGIDHVYPATLKVGEAVCFQTKGNLYTLARPHHDVFTLQGHPMYCPVPTPCTPGPLRIGYPFHFFASGCAELVTTTLIKYITAARTVA